jgi:CPA1 family monovalent cation:H+ antiporter
MRHEYEEHMRVLRANREGAAAEDDLALRHDQHYTALRLALLAQKRRTVIRLRDEGRIDDTVLRQVQASLDAEEVHLSRREAVD